MGAINGRLRRNRRNRLAAELQCTWTPRRLFTFGTSVGGAHWFTDPNTLYRRRNRLTYSSAPGNAVWIKARASIGVSAETDPDGYAAVKLVEDTTAANNHYLLQTVSPPLGQTHGAWYDVKAAERTRVVLTMFGLAGAECVFNLSSGTLVSKGAAASDATITSLGNGWYRVFATWPTIAAGTAAALILDNGTTATYTGDGASGVHVSKSHFEYGATTAPTYQPVPTTWPEAYLAAVGAENIYAWTDNAGTTPVTAVGDTIGLSLDRAFGGYRGPDVAVNGGFDSGTGWTLTSATISGGTLNISACASGTINAAQASLVAGKVYEVVYVVSALTGNLSLVGGLLSSTVTTPGTYRFVGVAGATALAIGARTGGVTSATVDSITCREIPGTHLIQATGTARPTLSARVNMLLASEDFSSANWQKVNGGTGSAPVVTNNAATAPNGTTTADKIDFSLGAGTTAGDYSIVQQSVSLTGTHKGAIWIKADAPVRIMLRVGATWLAVDATTEWQSFTPLQENSNSIQFGLRAGYGIASLPTAATVYVWGADLRTADDAAKNIPVYQRVGATAADHDTDGFPHYAEGDGTDNCWASVATVDGSGSDKVTVVAGVTKNSDAAAGIVLETTTSFSGNAGTIVMSASGAVNSWGWGVRGSTGAGLDPTGYAAPSTAVLLGVGDIAADYIALSVNGVSAASSNTDRGIGNFGNHTLYVLSRAGTSLRLNGRLYSLVFRFGAMGEADRNRLEQWTKNLMRLP